MSKSPTTAYSIEGLAHLLHENADTTAGLIILAFAMCLYFLPTLIGWSRGVKHPGLLFVGNLLFGWIFGVGWFAALVYAVASDAPPKRPLRPATPAYYDTHNLFSRREPRL